MNIRKLYDYLLLFSVRAKCTHGRVYLHSVLGMLRTLCVARFSSNQYSSGSAVVSDLVIISSGCVDGSALAMLSARHVARSGLVMLNTRYVADSDLAMVSVGYAADSDLAMVSVG